MICLAGSRILCIIVCDAGTWEINIVCSNGQRVINFGGLISEGELSEISDYIRRMLGEPDIYGLLMKSENKSVEMANKSEFGGVMNELYKTSNDR